MASIYVSNIEGTYLDLHRPALIIGGCFALVAVALSLFLILQHLRSYTNPEEQKWVVAVIFMVPAYATQSVFSLWNPNLSLACDTLKSCYEAFALYSFGRYLVACLGGERRVVEFLENESQKKLSKPLVEGKDESRGVRQRSFVNFFLRPSALGSGLFAVERFGLVQYMILKTVCAFLAFILTLFGVYGDGEFNWHYGYPYIALVLNFSQMWALYCLVQFYNVTHENLKPIKPLAKFVSFKAIVFATWWQGVGIALMCAFGLPSDEGRFQTALQDFLICIEMAIAAVAHVFVFSVEPYQFVPASEYGEVTCERTTAEFKLKEGDEEKPAALEKEDVQFEAPGTNVTDSFHDIVVQGGQSKLIFGDVVLTINQAVGPVEKGVTKIQETFHQRMVDSKDAEESEIVVDEHVEEESSVR
ncbi:hypothetical protein K2173_016235 [Erythroxylum novogranatense]|uniref:Uncharacterized protein n=1 Tax=Erythroxylum novogranatense TaxID=1862640 RepID=A0AAV8SGB8_9ROSI|nr:hypothetical protein K2173_016235 [Erythroxylum novogranatense]